MDILLPLLVVHRVVLLFNHIHTLYLRHIHTLHLNLFTSEVDPQRGEDLSYNSSPFEDEEKKLVDPQR
jgi:hypothetical protein